MDLISYLTIIRRRWLLLVGTVGTALLAVWITLPTAAETAVPMAASSYQAKAILISSPSNAVPPNLSLVALYTSVGAVPERAAAKLGYEGEVQQLAATVTVTPDSETGTLTISATGADAATTARTVNVFAAEVVAFLETRAQEAAQERLDELNEALAAYGRRMGVLDRRVAARPNDSALVAERAGLQTQVQSLVASAASIEEELSAPPPLEILQRGVALPQDLSGFTAPTDSSERFLIGAALGLVLGLALTLVVERLDSRLRSREQVEAALQLPVLAQIPSRPWYAPGASAVPSATDPGGTAAEAYRGLRSAVLLMKPDRFGNYLPAEWTGAADPKVFLVTSPRPSDGKSSTVANLAVVMAESGRRVLVLSLDFRNPRVHEYLDTPNGAGLSDLLSANRPDELESVVRETRFAGVSIATSGQQASHPGALLACAGPLIDAARLLADVVLVDSAPLLAVSDAVDLSPHVDAVLVVTRLNRTSTTQAQAAHRLLSRLGVPALGAVLIGGFAFGRYDRYPGGGLANPPHDDSWAPAHDQEFQTDRDSSSAARATTPEGRGHDG